ncbi:MAG: recombination protein RecR [Parachlamydiaceae bacterium]|nr:recombination protein RecR [Parachlamydiaceae bacterium]
MRYPAHLLKLIDVLKKLPGVGSKSAERFAFQLLLWSPDELEAMSSTIQEIPLRLKHCSDCGCLTGEEACSFCTPVREQSGLLCIVASPRDAFAIEATQEYKGLYHVLGGVLSPMDGFGSDMLTLEKLQERIKRLKINEIVIALDSTLEGDATSLYLKRELEPQKVHVTRLAFGLPMGSSLDYVDGGTLARAFSGRALF